MKAFHRITSRRFSRHYLQGRYAYYGLGDSFKLFRENNFLIYFFKIFLCTLKYTLKLFISILLFPYPIKLRYFWRLKGLLNHCFFIVKDKNFRNYVKLDNWKEYKFKNLKSLKYKKSFW